jgi:23S rRNA pseudouridine1911/1915/1917 synthase
MSAADRAPLRQLQILLEDNHLLAVVKPAGLLVQGDRTGDPTLLDAAKAYLKEKYAKPGNVYLGLVHRLDRPVSGVVLLARTSKAAGRLSRQFRERSVTKRYLAVVEGSPPDERGVLVAQLARDGDAGGVTRAAAAPFPGSRAAELEYIVLARHDRRALLRVAPAGGRRHQIRAQLALAGWPIVGDVKYGARAGRRDRSIALHAERLEVVHPVRDERIILVAPVPRGWPWSGSIPAEE